MKAVRETEEQKSKKASRRTKGMKPIFECHCECDSDEETEDSDDEAGATGYDKILKKCKDRESIRSQYKAVYKKTRKVLKWVPMTRGRTYESLERLYQVINDIQLIREGDGYDSEDDDFSVYSLIKDFWQIG